MPKDRNARRKNGRAGLAGLVHLNLIGVGLESLTAKQAIESLSELLRESGHVGANFSSAVWEREKAHPTGLPTVPVGVAIPHTDAHHVTRSGIAVGILRNGVDFLQMGHRDAPAIPVRIVFLLAIKETEKQVRMIQELVGLLQSPDLLRRLAGAQDAAEVRSVLKPRRPTQASSRLHA